MGNISRISAGCSVCWFPEANVPYHYHKDRESIVIPLSGEAVEIVEGKETVVRPGDILLIPVR